MLSKSLEQQSTKKLIFLNLNIYLTNNVTGVLTFQMLLSNVKIFNKLQNLKTIFIKTGIFLSLAAYWGVILVGTFITFN
jgi:hypothetical protein